MALTLQQLQANLDAVNAAIGDPTLKVRFPDGREVTYRSMDELRKAKTSASCREEPAAASGLRSINAATALRGRPCTTGGSAYGELPGV